MKLLQTLVVVTLVAGAAPAQPVSEARPNLAVHISGRLLNSLVQRPVDRTQPVEQDILGTMYYGLGRTLGQVRAELVPDPARGSIEMVMTGTTYTDNLGFRGAYQVHTQSTIPFEVRKRLAIDGKQIYPYPACASAVAESEILALAHGGSTGFSLRTLLACAKAYQDQELSERIVADRARCRLATDFDREIYTEVERGHRALADVLETARKLGLQPRPFEWNTTADHIGVKITIPAPGQPPVTFPPPAPPKPADLTVALHPSLVEGFAEKALAGKTLSVVQLGEALRNGLDSLDGRLAGRLTRLGELTKLLKDLNLKPVPMTFTVRRPVSVTVDGQGFTIVLHAAGFKDGMRTYPAADIRADYRFEKTPTGFAVVRQGGVQVVAPPGASTGLDAIFRTQLQLFFNLLLVDRLALENFPLPAAQGRKPSQLVAEQVTVKDGWLQLAWVRQED